MILAPQDVLVPLVKAVQVLLALQGQLDPDTPVPQDPVDLLACRVYKALPVSKVRKDLLAPMVKLVLLGHWADHLVLQEILALQELQDQLAKQDQLGQLVQLAIQDQLDLQALQALQDPQELQGLLVPKPLGLLDPQVKQGLLGQLALLAQK